MIKERENRFSHRDQVPQLEEASVGLVAKSEFRLKWFLNKDHGTGMKVSPDGRFLTMLKALVNGTYPITHGYREVPVGVRFQSPWRKELGTDSGIHVVVDKR